MSEIDWDWLRSTLAVLEAGTLQGASDRLGVSAPTLSRHVAKLEEQLGVPLFDRSGRGLRPTPDAEALLPAARDVKSAVDQLLRQATGREAADAGPVRVTTSVVHGLYLLPEWVRAFREVHPEIVVDLVLDDAPTDLLSREAELAVRLFRPTGADLLARRCGSVPSGFFASQAYVDAHGVPDDYVGLRDHALIGYDRATVYLEAAAALGVPLSRDDFVFRSDAPAAHIEAACAGVGLAVMALPIGALKGLVRVLPDRVVHQQDVWLAAHPDVRRSPRVRRAWDALATSLTELCGAYV